MHASIYPLTQSHNYPMQDFIEYLKIEFISKQYSNHIYQLFFSVLSIFAALMYGHRFSNKPPICINHRVWGKETVSQHVFEW